MRLLLTRAEGDSLHLAERLRALGHTAVEAPLFEIEYSDNAPPALDGVQALLVTSANGVLGFARSRPERDIPVFAVGARTAAAAREAGFKTVRSADGDATKLAEKTALWADPERGALLHATAPSGENTLAALLAPAGFTVKTAIVYRSVPALRLPDAAKTALRANALDGVLLLSPGTASTFAALVQRAGLESACGRLAFFCISAATVAALGRLPRGRIAVAARPALEAVLELLP